MAAQALAEAAARLADAGLERAPVDEAIERIVRAIVAVGDRYAVSSMGRSSSTRPRPSASSPRRCARSSRAGIESGLLRQDISAEVLLELFGGALVRRCQAHPAAASSASKTRAQPPLPSSWTAPAHADGYAARWDDARL